MSQELEKTTQRTDSEKFFEECLKYLGIPYEIYQVFCFKCCANFNWKSSDCPSCYLGRHILGKGDFCRPDFILRHNKQVGIVYINGSIHDKGRQKKKDQAQIKEFIRNKIHVFVVENDELVEMGFSATNRWEKIPWRNLAIVQFIWDCMRDPKLYKKYVGLKDTTARLYIKSN